MRNLSEPDDSVRKKAKVMNKYPIKELGRLKAILPAVRDVGLIRRVK